MMMMMMMMMIMMMMMMMMICTLSLHIKLSLQLSFIYKNTRRVLSETKAIMSPPPLCHWMESIFFVEEGEILI